MDKYKGKSIEELEKIWERLKNECYELRMEIEKRKGSAHIVNVDYTKYLTD